MHSTSQHSTTRWSDHRAFHQSTQYHMVFRSPYIPPVNTLPHGGQIIVHSTSQHSTTWWSDHRVFHWSTQYHMVVRSSYIHQVNTVLYGGQINQAFKPSPKHEDWLQQNQGSGFKGTCKTPSGIRQYCLGHHTLNYHYSPPPFFFVW